MYICFNINFLSLSLILDILLYLFRPFTKLPCNISVYYCIHHLYLKVEFQVFQIVELKPISSSPNPGIFVGWPDQVGQTTAQLDYCHKTRAIFSQNLFFPFFEPLFPHFPASRAQQNREIRNSLRGSAMSATHWRAFVQSKLSKVALKPCASLRSSSIIWRSRATRLACTPRIPARMSNPNDLGNLRSFSMTCAKPPCRSLRCQDLYLCTSNASKLSTCRPNSTAK
jgi:hypothetical protein